MIKNGIRIAVLLVIQTLWLGTSNSAEPAGAKKSEELLKQESIYKSRGEQRPEGYVIDRSLSMYADVLSSDFDGTLASLGPKDRWLDIGAGMGQAILDYSAPAYDLAHIERRGKKAQAVAISIEDRRTPAWQQAAASLGANQLQYFINKRLREYSLEELGQFQIITDVIGGFSYADNLSLFMEKVLAFLVLNGNFYTVLQDVHMEDGSNKPYYAGAPFLTQIENPDGTEVKVCSWLKSITCVEVTCEKKMDWKPPVEIYRVRKVCNNPTVPDLVTTHYEAGTPPERGFQLKR